MLCQLSIYNYQFTKRSINFYAMLKFRTGSINLYRSAMFCVRTYSSIRKNSVSPLLIVNYQFSPFNFITAIHDAKPTSAQRGGYQH